MKQHEQQIKKTDEEQREQRDKKSLKSHDLMKIVIAAILGAVVAGLFSYFSVFFTFNQRLAFIEGKMEMLEKLTAKVESIEKNVAGITIDLLQKQPPGSASEIEKYIINKIKEQQKKHVKESYGEEAYQCFTKEDYDKFVNNEVVETITSDLLNDNMFKNMLLDLRKLSNNEKNQIIEKAKRIYKPTWGEIGDISKEGQTEYGQKAEKDITDAIVSMLR